jgi:hypothetical protein
MVIIQGRLQNIKSQTKQRFRSIKINSLKNGICKKICIKFWKFNTTFNIINSINKSINDFKPLSDERCDILAKQYTQLKLLMLDEISLIGSQMFSFVDKRLRIIKHKHTQK